jgi:hypothetical protein
MKRKQQEENDLDEDDFDYIISPDKHSLRIQKPVTIQLSQK